MARVVNTAAELYYYISQNTKTVLFITQKGCPACQKIETRLKNLQYKKHKDLSFIIADYNNIELRQIIGYIEGTPTTRIYQNGIQLTKELVDGSVSEFRKVIHSQSKYRNKFEF